eukprot:15474151-Alexandrium_andersonii.AAC.1
MASWLGNPSSSAAPSKRSSDWNADVSDGDESTFTFKVPDDDVASEASTHASRASFTSEWAKVADGAPEAHQQPKKQAKTAEYKIARRARCQGPEACRPCGEDGQQ